MATKQTEGEAPRQLTQINREAVKTLAIAVGVREAARQLGLNENTVRQWSRRQGWFKQPDPIPLPPTIIKQNGHSVSSVTTPSDALREVLEQDNRQTRLGLSKAARKASEYLGEAESEFILAKSEDLHRVAKTASLVHQWESNSNAAGPIQFNVLAQRAYFGQSKQD